MNIIVSPSGMLYGSEKVLLDFLQSTRRRYRVYVPAGSPLWAYAQAHLAARHDWRVFRNSRWGIVRLYARLLFWAASGALRTLYINEGGHVRYGHLLARLRPRLRVLVHLRLLQSAREHHRLGQPLPNFRLALVSDFLKIHLPAGRPDASVCYDAYAYAPQPPVFARQVAGEALHIGIVARIDRWKGLEELMAWLPYAAAQRPDWPLHLHFFGGVRDAALYADLQACAAALPFACHFHGFVDDLAAIYGRVHLLLHLSREDAFPRILHESVDYGVPLLGFAACGVQDFFRILGEERLLLPADAPDWGQQLLDKLLWAQAHYAELQALWQALRPLAAARFSLAAYTAGIEQLLGLEALPE